MLGRIAKLLFLAVIPALSWAGSLQVMVFEDGIPAQGQEIILNGQQKLKTNQDGLLQHSLPEGEHFIELKQSEKIHSQSFLVADSQTTHLLVNTNSQDDQIQMTVSEPDGSELEKSKKQGPLVKFEGMVRDENQKPLKGAKIFLTGVDETLVSDESGRFSAKVSEGIYTVSFVKKGYTTQTLESQKVSEGDELELQVQLIPAGLELDEYVVMAPHIEGSTASLIQVRKKATTVADVLGSEQMSKSGDSDAASSLARATGLTVVDGRFVYIRGLGERYSNVLINGMTLPSPDPSRRVLQLDLPPSDILESIVIQKSYSPSFPGSFGGGVVNLKTKNIPDDFRANISLSTGYESGQSEALSYAGGERDYTGMDDGTRKLPGVIAQALSNNQRLSGTDEEKIEYGLAFKRNYSTQKKEVGLPPGLKMSIGDTLKYRGKKLGFNVAGLYSDSYSNTDIDQRDFDVVSSDSSELSEVGSKKTLRSDRNIRLSGMLNLGLDLGPSAVIKANTLALRKTTDRVEKRVIRTQDNQIEGHSIEWEERELLSQILIGTHELTQSPEHKIEWSGAISRARMDRPDARYYQLLIDGGERRFDNQGRSNERIFSEVQDDVKEGQISYQLPFSEAGNFQFKTRVGLGVMEKNRESVTRRFKYEVDTAQAIQITGDPSILGQSPDAICTDQVIREGACEIVDTTVPSDRFEADQSLQSYFLDSETLLYERLRLNAGIRFENSIQNITTFEGVARTPVEGSLEMRDYLPALGLTYFLTEKMQLRLGYSETISRPAFKDLNPVGYYDDEKNRNVSGNPQLRGTIIENIDARWEWYFGNQENVSLGVFHKRFQNPIEEVAGSFQNGVLTYSEGGFQLANVGNATARGFEVEFRKNFSFISSELQPLALGGNYSWIDSNMTIFPELSSQVTNENRPLQGQSPYVINLNLDYDNLDTGTTATLLYNIFGARIDTVGTDRRPDTYQESYNSVDFVFSQSFGDNERNKFGFKFQNILNPEVVLSMGDEIKETYRKGRKMSVSFTRSF